MVILGNIKILIIKYIIEIGKVKLDFKNYIYKKNN